MIRSKTNYKLIFRFVFHLKMDDALFQVNQNFELIQMEHKCNTC
jgi:hypothetical protein